MWWCSRSIPCMRLKKLQAWIDDLPTTEFMQAPNFDFTKISWDDLVNLQCWRLYWAYDGKRWNMKYRNNNRISSEEHVLFNGMIISSSKYLKNTFHGNTSLHTNFWVHPILTSFWMLQGIFDVDVNCLFFFFIHSTGWFSGPKKHVEDKKLFQRNPKMASFSNFKAFILQSS